MTELSDDEMKRLAKLVAAELHDIRRSAPFLLDEDEAAKMLGTTARSLQQIRYDGTGPPFIKLGTSKRAPIRYGIDDLHLWVATRQRYNSTRAAMNDGVDEHSRDDPREPGTGKPPRDDRLGPRTQPGSLAAVLTMKRLK